MALILRPSDTATPSDNSAWWVRVATGAASLLALAVAAYWVTRWIAPMPALPATPEVNDPAQAARDIADRHLFGASTDALVAPAAVSGSSWRLLGVSASNPRAKSVSFALLQEAGGATITAMEGSEIAPGVILRRVEPNQIEIERAGIREIIPLDNAGNAPGRM